MTIKAYKWLQNYEDISILQIGKILQTLNETLKVLPNSVFFALTGLHPPLPTLTSEGGLLVILSEANYYNVFIKFTTSSKEYIFSCTKKFLPDDSFTYVKFFPSKKSSV